MKVSRKRVDRQGRVVLPPDLRRRLAGDGREVILLDHGDRAELLPATVDITKFFGAFRADLDPTLPLDYKGLRATLLRRKHGLRRR